MPGPHVFFVNAFRDYFDAGGRKIPSDLQPLVNLTNILFHAAQLNVSVALAT